MAIVNTDFDTIKNLPLFFYFTGTRIVFKDFLDTGEQCIFVFWNIQRDDIDALLAMCETISSIYEQWDLKFIFVHMFAIERTRTTRVGDILAVEETLLDEKDDLFFEASHNIEFFYMEPCEVEHLESQLCGTRIVCFLGNIIYAAFDEYMQPYELERLLWEFFPAYENLISLQVYETLCP